MREDQDRLTNLGIEVAVITFDADFMARAYVEQTDLPWPLLIDGDRRLYRAYNMERANWWSIYGPASIWNYMKLIFGRGRKIEEPGSDLRQLGGDVLIDPTGLVRFHHVSESPHDRPSVESILVHVLDS